jgi:hypothetical protein
MFYNYKGESCRLKGSAQPPQRIWLMTFQQSPNYIFFWPGGFVIDQGGKKGRRFLFVSRYAKGIELVNFRKRMQRMDIIQIAPFDFSQD